MKIAICITTKGRPEYLRRSLEGHNKFLPAGAKIFVVNDGTKDPEFLGGDIDHFYFEETVGIPKAKNKCLELADEWGADRIFLFDDDCYPIADNWWQPYVESPEPHLMYIFQDFATGRKLNDTKILYADSKIIGYSHPRGCMLYLDRKVLDVVGGYDDRYDTWGYEHGDLSNRIYNHNLTSFRYADIPESNKLIYSADEHEEAESTVTGQHRQTLLQKNKVLHDKNFHSIRHCNYKTSNSIILASYFVDHLDTQRNKKWVANLDDLDALVTSCKKLNQRLVILNDCFDEFDTGLVCSVRIDTKMNPYFQRWLSQYQYLRDHPEIDNVFCVDATDVQLLKDPFGNINNEILYVGDESSVLNCKWMRTNFLRLKPFFVEHAGKPLLNCGVVGGSRKLVMSICHDIYGAYFDMPHKVGKLDMGIFNYLCYTKYRTAYHHRIQKI